MIKQCLIFFDSMNLNSIIAATVSVTAVVTLL